MIRGLDHEMRNAMMPLLLHLDLLDLQGASSAQLTDRAPDLVANLHRLANGLLLRAQATSQTAPVESMHLAAWWRALGGMLRATLPRDVVLDVRIPASLPPIAMQPLVLGQVCLHLMVHLRLALPPRGPHRVRISARPSSEGVNMSIAEGAAQRTSAAHDSSVPTITPSWGLVQANELLAISGGALRGYSAVTRGTHLTILLREAGATRLVQSPLRRTTTTRADEPSPRASARTVPPAATAGSRQDTMRRVLIIDDNAALTSALALRLAIEGHFDTVPAMHDLHDSVPRILALAPSIVLLDLNLPGTDHPLDVVRQMRKLAPATRVVILTGNPSAAAVTDARAAGAAGFIAKGVAPERLIAALRRLDDDPFVLELDA